MVGSALAPTLWDADLATREPDLPDGRSRAHATLREAARSGPTAGPAPGDGFTLDRAITRLWEATIRHQVSACPWCEGEMRPRYGAGALPIGALCTECRSSLS